RKAPSASAVCCRRNELSDASNYRDSFARGGKVSPDELVSDTGIPEFPRTRTERRSQPLELNAKSRLLFWILRAIIHALSLIPDFILYPLGVVFGNLAYRLDRRHVRIGLKNLEIAFPEKSERERRHILRESYVNLGRSGAEYVRLGGFFYRRLKRRVAYQGL